MTESKTHGSIWFKDDLKVILFLGGIMSSAVAVGAFIIRFIPEGGMVVIWDLIGTHVTLSSSSVALLIVASLAAEIFTIANMRKPSRRLETAVILLFTALTATFALLFGRYFLLALTAEAFPGLMLLLSLAVFAGVYVLFLVLIDAVSERAKNAALALFSVTTGAFIATSFETWIIILVLVAVVGIDTFVGMVLRWKHPSQSFEPLRTSLTTPNWAIGLGDLLSYSIIATHAYVLGGSYLGGSAIALVLLAATITLSVMRRKALTRVPGLPLTLTPSIALVALAWLGVVR